MRYVTMPQTVIFLVVMVQYVLAINEDDNCKGSCNYSIEYCDRFESSCRPCKAHCLNSPLDVCEKDCPGYLKGLLFSTTNNAELAEKSDVTMLMAMLVAVAVVSCITLLILLVLVTYKVKGRRRREKEVIPMSHFQGTPPRPRSSTPNQNHHHNNLNTSYFERQIPSPPPPSTSTALPNGLGRSMQTVTTQLSEETNSSTASRRHPHQLSNGGRSSFQSGKFSRRSPPPLSRIPAEDRLPELSSPNGRGYDNPAINASTPSSGPASPGTMVTGATTATSSDRMANNRPPAPPYTISHSQVL